MARTPETIQLFDYDHDITVRVMPMGASKAQKWLLRALTVLGGGNAKDSFFDPEVLKKGAQNLDFSALNLPSLLAALSYENMETLVDMLWPCFTVWQGAKTDGAGTVLNVDNVDSIIMDHKTLLAMQRKLLNMQYGFFPDAAPLNTGEPEAAPIHPA